VRRLITWVAGAAGGLAAYKAATRRNAEPEPVEGDPAAELRAKLQQARSEEPEPVVVPEEPAMPDDRRRSVHDQARAAIDEMRGDGT
jgi:hypothetical protein